MAGAGNRQTSITIPATDGYELAATRFEPEGKARAIVVITSAVAVRQSFYAPFAAYLAERGMAGVTFDYRGIAASAPESLKDFDAPMRDWALKDVAGVIEWARAEWPKAPLCYAGHSFGAQALGLTERNAHVARAALVSPLTGYWGNFAPGERYKVFASMQIGGRALCALFGKVPAWTGVGEAIPASVFTEWAGWCLRPDFFFADDSLPETANFARYAGALRGVGLTDDTWGTPAAVEALMRHYTGARAERVWYEPGKAGLERIGHMGFFRPASVEPLWRETADWLLGKA